MSSWNGSKLTARLHPVTVRRLLVAAGGAALLGATAALFRAFDAHSHSASDTLRPFVLTAVPLWVAALATARALLRRR